MTIQPGLSALIEADRARRLHAAFRTASRSSRTAIAKLSTRDRAHLERSLLRRLWPLE
jgi:hypothetical protein